MLRPLLIASLLTLALGACTWVKMEPAAFEVRVARDAEDLAYCERRGELTVSVRDRVGLYERSDLKVRDELETLARNEAPRLNADTVQPISQPTQGDQRFAAFSCRGATARTATQSEPVQPAATRDGGVQTFPLRD
jgi:hypothetical protein